MPVETTDDQVNNLKTALESACGEPLIVIGDSPHTKLITFESKNFQFHVSMGFLQARVPEDHEQGIAQRFENALAGAKLEPGIYQLGCRSRWEIPTTEIPKEYFVLRL